MPDEDSTAFQRSLCRAAEQQLNRRDMLRLSGGAFLGLAGLGIAGCGGDDAPKKSATAATALTADGDASGSLTVIEWPGFEVKELWRPYARDFPGEKPKYAITTDPYKKAVNGYEADLAHPGLSDLKRWLDTDLIQPFDTSLLKNFKDLSPALVEQCTVDGKVMAIPSDWGFNSVIYRSDKVQIDEPSWGLLFDDRYKGHIAWRDSARTMFVASGLYLGVPKPFDMTDDELDRVEQLLKDKKSLVRKFWTGETELRVDFAGGDIWIAPGEGGTVVSMEKRGLPVVLMDPKEGRLSWFEGFVLSKDAARPYRAHRYVDAWTSPESGLWMNKNYSYGSSNTAIDLSKLDPKLVKTFKLDDPNALSEGVIRYDYTPRMQEYEKRWAAVKAA